MISRVRIVGCGGYLANVAAIVASPEFESSAALYFGMLGGLTELVFLLWLLIMGTGRSAPTPLTSGAVRHTV